MGPPDSPDSCMKYSGRPTISLLLMLDYAASELAGQAVYEVLLYKIACEKSFNARFGGDTCFGEYDGGFNFCVHLGCVI